MITRIPDSVREKIMNGTKDERKYLCEEFSYFKWYYFSHYMTHKVPAFHWDMDSDLRDMDQAVFKYLAWVMYRDSAKTAQIKMREVYNICYRKKKYINWDSQDKSNAEQALFDITMELQTNQRLLADFGHLYNVSVTDDQKKMKRISKFITENDIMVEAFSTQEPIRGRLYRQYRPDEVVVDDFENNITKKSQPKTDSVIDHFKEMFGALPADANVIFLCNYITDSGSVQYVMDLAENNPDFRLRKVPLHDENTGEITWKDKFVETDAEAWEINKTIEDKKKWKKSVESIKRVLKEDYSGEMELNPASPEDLYFDLDRINEHIRDCKSPVKEVGGFQIWREYDPSHLYCLGADTSMGVGGDSSTTALGDFTLFPNEIIGAYANNKIAPDKFAHELKREGLMFGECLIAPESNAESGGACVNELKHIYDIGKIYRRLPPKSDVKDIPTDKLGWESNQATVPEMFSQFRTAYNDGHIKVRDRRILKEMSKFTNSDLEAHSKSIRGRSGVTKHFDLLRAVVICYAARTQARVADIKSTYVQPEYEGVSAFETPKAKETKTLDGSNKFSFDPFGGNPHDPFSHTDQVP